MMRNAMGFAILSLLPLLGCATRGDNGSASLKQGKQAPDFELPALDGGTVRLSSLRGRPVVLAFFGVNCVPCRAEAPYLTKLANKHKSDGLVVLSVHAWSDDETKADVAKFAKDLKLEHKILLNGSVTAKESYEVQYVPAVFFIDKDGTVNSIHGDESLDQGAARLLGRRG